TLFSASDDRTWCAWDVPTLTLVSQSEDSGARTVDVQLSPNGKTVFTADIDGTVRCTSLEGKQRPINVIAELPDGVGSISVDAIGRRVAIASREGSVRILNLDDQSRLAKPFENSNIWATQNVRIHDLCFSADDSYLHAVDNDGMWTVWNASIDATSLDLDVTSLFSAPWDGNISMDQITPDACIFTANLKVFCWDTNTNRVDQLADYDSPVTCLVTNERNGFVFTGHLNGQIRAWHFTDQQLRPLWSYAASKQSNEVSTLSYSAARNQIAVALQSAGSMVRILDAGNGSMERILGIPGLNTEKNGSLVFSDDGKWLACAVDREIIIWDLASDEYRRFSGDNNTINSMCVHPNNKFLVSGGQDRSIRIWNMRTGELFTEFRHKEGIHYVHVSSDGNLIVSADARGRVVLWHIAAKKLLFELDSMDGLVNLAKSWSGPKLFTKNKTTIRAENFGGR
ncbi:MAG TPA: hypothetical protein VM260_05425, partial [Pirellula sp.]|nr:hypothetical protein [Pirellula sp.]